MTKRPKTTKPKPHPGWVRGEDLLIELGVSVGLSRREAAKQARAAMKEKRDARGR